MSAAVYILSERLASGEPSKGPKVEPFMTVPWQKLQTMHESCACVFGSATLTCPSYIAGLSVHFPLRDRKCNQIVFQLKSTLFCRFLSFTLTSFRPWCEPPTSSLRFARRHRLVSTAITYGSLTESLFRFRSFDRVHTIKRRIESCPIPRM